MRTPTTSPKTKQLTLTMPVMGTYTLTAVGNVLILHTSIYVKTVVVSTTNTSALAVATDDAVPTVVMTAAEGAEANLVTGKQMFNAIASDRHYQLRSGKQIEAVVSGEDMDVSGVIHIVAMYVPISSGAYLA